MSGIDPKDRAQVLREVARALREMPPLYTFGDAADAIDGAAHKLSPESPDPVVSDLLRGVA